MHSSGGERRTRPARPEDADEMARIYSHYVLQTSVTFEEIAVTGEEMARRIQQTAAANLPWVVREEDGKIVGYAYGRPWRPRHAYRFSSELAVYVTAGRTGKGMGSVLYLDLLDALRQCGVHVAIGGVVLPNQPSVALHERLGFRKVAHFEQVGFKFERWLDVGYWQLIL